MKFRKSIRWRTVLICMVVSTLFFAAIFSIFYWQSYKLLKQQSMDSALQSLEIHNSYLSAVMDSATATIYSYDVNNDALFGNSEEALSYLNSIQPSSYLICNTMILDKDSIIAIRDKWRPWAYSGLVQIDNFTSAAQRGRIVTSQPYYSNYLASRAIALVRSVINPKTQEERFIVSEISLSSMFYPLSTKLSEVDELIVLAENGSLMYLKAGCPFIRYTADNNGLLDISPELREKLIPLSSGCFEISADGYDYIVQKVLSERGWRLYVLMDTKEFHHMQNKAVRVYLMIAAIAVLCLTVMSLFLSQSVLKPVLKLVGEIDTISADQLLPIPENKSPSEINRLRHSFNQLIVRLQQSSREREQIERTKYELEYRTLQSQIQPHFMFNIHACCMALIESGNPKAASEMLAEMDILLRQSIHPEPIITLGQELELCDHYISLNRRRLGNVFDYNVSNWEPYADTKIPRLLLQPVIENALYHGLLGLDYRGCIDLSIIQLSDMLHIVIEDNGRGISQDRLKKIQSGKDENLTGQHGMVCIGLASVQKRIQGYYGPDCGLYISSREGIGTRVEIVIHRNMPINL